MYAVEEKVAAWLGSGSQAAWVVNPKLRSIHIHRPGNSIQSLTENDVLDEQDVIPGFQLIVAELFSRELRGSSVSGGINLSHRILLAHPFYFPSHC